MNCTMAGKFSDWNHKQRSQIVEPVFGRIKDIRCCDRFMRRWIGGRKSERSLLCASHNLLKLCPERHAGIKERGDVFKLLRLSFLASLKKQG